MDLLVAAATSEPSGQSVRLIIVLLLAVALGLACLTFWYWRFTDPRRRQVAAVTPATVMPNESEAEQLTPVPPTTTRLDPDSSTAPIAVPAVTGQLPAVVLDGVEEAQLSLPSEPPGAGSGGSATDFAAAVSEHRDRSGETVTRQVPPLVDAPPADDAQSDPSQGDRPPDSSDGPRPGGEDNQLSGDDVPDRIDGSGSGDTEVRAGVPTDLEFSSVLSEAVKTGEVNLTDDQWEQLADAVLDAIGWGHLDDEAAADACSGDDSESERSSHPGEAVASHTVGALD